MKILKLQIKDKHAKLLTKLAKQVNFVWNYGNALCYTHLKRTLITIIKFEAVGGIVKLVNEAYTSKCSALDLEPIGKQTEYKGERIKRGLFKSNKGIVINADINGGLNILRKVVKGDLISDLIESKQWAMQLPMRICV